MSAKRWPELEWWAFLCFFNESRTITKDIASFMGELMGVPKKEVINRARYWKDEWLTSQERFKKSIVLRDGNTCQYCGNCYGMWFLLVVEHVVPSKLGGPFEPHNLVASCASCNCRKKSTVWIPANLDTITRNHLEWRERILREANRELQASSVAKIIRFES